MERRDFIGSFASLGTIAVAGCSEDPTQDEDQENPRRNPSAEIVSSEIITDEEDTNWIKIEVENPTSSNHGRIRVNSTVRSESGDVIDAPSHLLDLLPGNELWREYRIVAGQQRQNADSVETTLEAEDAAVASNQIEDANVINSTLNQGFREGTGITGEVEFGDVQSSQLYLVGLVFNQEGTLRGSVGTILNDVSSGETRAFSARTVGNKTPQGMDSELPTSHEIFIFDGIP